MVEVRILLDNELEFYQKILFDAGAENDLTVETHDRYWANINFDELSLMSENEIKNSCIRVRECSKVAGSLVDENSENNNFGNEKKYCIENFNLYDSQKSDRFYVTREQLNKIIKDIEENGWYLIIDTFKIDYQYSLKDIKSKIQLQEIDNIGLVLYYDNPDYYQMPSDLQRKALIDELNLYGFDFHYQIQDIDKLKTLLLGCDCYSFH